MGDNISTNIYPCQLKRSEVDDVFLSLPLEAWEMEEEGEKTKKREEKEREENVGRKQWGIKT